MSGIFNYINHKSTITPEDITPDIYNFFMHEAHPWPHPNSILINNDTLFQYDTFGNPISFKSKSPNMTWTRGTLLSKYNEL